MMQLQKDFLFDKVYVPFNSFKLFGTAIREIPRDAVNIIFEKYLSSGDIAKAASSNKTWLRICKESLPKVLIQEARNEANKLRIYGPINLNVHPAFTDGYLSVSPGKDFASTRKFLGGWIAEIFASLSSSDAENLGKFYHRFFQNPTRPMGAVARSIICALRSSARQKQSTFQIESNPLCRELNVAMTQKFLTTVRAHNFGDLEWINFVREMENSHSFPFLLAQEGLDLDKIPCPEVRLELLRYYPEESKEEAALIAFNRISSFERRAQHAIRWKRLSERTNSPLISNVVEKLLSSERGDLLFEQMELQSGERNADESSISGVIYAGRACQTLILVLTIGGIVYGILFPNIVSLTVTCVSEVTLIVVFGVLEYLIRKMTKVNHIHNQKEAYLL